MLEAVSILIEVLKSPNLQSELVCSAAYIRFSFVEYCALCCFFTGTTLQIHGGHLSIKTLSKLKRQIFLLKNHK